MNKTKVVILGAGPAGLAAAYGLSANQRLRDRYDVTIYQAGWRAGGKCASGRAGPENRIVQNGTHYLFGCYDSTLAVMRNAYAELGQTGVNDFGDYDKSLLPRDMLALKHRFRGKWRLWPIPLPSNTSVPGLDTGNLRPVDYLSMFLQMLVTFVLGANLGHKLRPSSPFDTDRPMALRAIYAVVWPVLLVVSWAIWALSLLFTHLVADLLWLCGDRHYLSVAKLLSGLRAINRGLLQRPAQRIWTLFQVFTSFDFACTVGIGLLRDKVPALGLSAIENDEFTAWLAKHGAAEQTLAAPFVSTWYDAVAAYEDGDPAKPNLSAGVSMMAIYRALLTFKGHFAFQMRAEVGDTFVGPVYECLRRRGVKFRFFHRVWDIIPGDGDLINEISIEQQVALTSGDPESYAPFITVGGLKVWPEAPNWDQLDLPPDQRPADLDSFYTTWRGQTLPPLRRGRDFDALVLAMPVASLPTSCSRILERSEKWRDMVKNLPGVESQTMRLYFDATLQDLGWNLPTPILSSYAMPFATWEDNGHLAEVETWPAGKAPKSIATLFGPLPAPHLSPPHTDTGYPQTQNDVVTQNTLNFLQNDIGGIWPGATAPSDPNAIDWAKLVDLHGNPTGPARMNFQYLRANCGPLQRYTVAQAGTAKHRLPSDNSQFSNMMLAGDWTQNHYLIGSVEGAIMSGLQASRKICGYPEIVPGENTGL